MKYEGEVEVAYILTIKETNVLAFEFNTVKPLYVEEAQDEFNFFRIEANLETDEKTIHVASEDEWYIHEDATYLFEPEEIWKQCRDKYNQKAMYDATDEYESFHRLEELSLI